MYQNISQAHATVLKIDRPRPRIAVYSSQTDADAVELALRDAKIPYGTHPQQRNGAFTAASCNHIYDRDILSGELQRATPAGDPVYTWLHTHHEDYTGFNGGCDRFDRSCYDWDDGGAFGSRISLISKSASTTTELCSYCRNYYFGDPAAGWGWEFDRTKCYRVRKLQTYCGPYYKAGYTNDAAHGVTEMEMCPVCFPWYSAKNGNVWPAAFPKTSGGKTYPTDYPTCWLHVAAPKSCMDWDLGSGGDAARDLYKLASTSTDLCPYCRGFYFYNNTANWDSPKKKVGYDQAQCKNWGVRCGDRITASGTFWHDLASYSTLMCIGMNAAYPQCRAAKDSWDTVASFPAFGFANDATYQAMPSKLLDAAGNIVSKNNTRPLPADSPVVLHPSAVQQMKWKLSELILQHVKDGGFFYSQCFAPETLGMALWQRRIWLDQLTGASAVGAAAYADVMGFKNFNYYAFPWGWNGNGGNSPTYSTINGSQNGTFPLNDAFDARCQDHGGNCSGGTGYTDCFSTTTLKTTVGSETVVVLGSYDATHPEYFKGEKPGNAATPGQYCFMGGHFLNDIQSKRLVLNNVLLGALAEKIAGNAVVTKQKSNYGIIDPDNVQGGGADDYRDYFINGYNQPINLDYRITPEPGNKVGPTDQAVAQRLASGGQLVIVPITDVGPEVWGNSAQNNGATSIYELQGQDNLGGNHIYASGSADAGNFQSVVRVIGFAEFMIVPAGDAYASNTQVIGGYQNGQVRGIFLRYIVQPYVDYTPPN